MRRTGAGRDSTKGFMEHVQDYGQLALANLLWVAMALPLVTLPAATAGLVAVMSNWVRDGRPEAWPVFFASFRRQFWRATRVALIDLFLVLPIGIDVMIVQQAGSGDPLMVVARGLSVAALVFLAAVNLYLWPLLATGAPLGRLWRTAATLVLYRPLPSLLTLTACGLVFGLGLILPKGLFLFFIVAAVALIGCYGADRVFRRLPADDRFAGLPSLPANQRSFERGTG